MKTLKHHAERAYSEFLREQDGIKQEPFAILCGFSISGYSQFIHGRRNGSPEMFRKIAEKHQMTYKQFKEEAKKYYESIQEPQNSGDAGMVSVAEMLAQILVKLGAMEGDIKLLKSMHNAPTSGAAGNNQR